MLRVRLLPIFAGCCLLLASCAKSSPPTSGTNVPNSPSNSPAPSPTFQRWKSEDAIEVFRTAGLEIGNTPTMTREDYGIAPYVAVEGLRLQIPSLAEDSDGNGKIDAEEADVGGRVMSFKAREDLDKTKNYYDDLGKESAVLYSYTFVKDNILVQINGALSQEKANGYDRALQTLGS